MAGTLVKVRFKLAWQNYKVGDEITPNGVLRDWLLAHGYVELVGGGGERPAKLAGKVARKIAAATKGLFRH